MDFDKDTLDTGKTLKEIIDYLIEKENIYKNPSDFCTQNNIPKQTLSTQYSKKNNITPSMLKIAQILNINLNYFFNKKRGMFLNKYIPYINDLKDLEKFKNDLIMKDDSYSYLCLPPLVNDTLLKDYSKEQLNKIVAFQEDNKIIYLDYNKNSLEKIVKGDYLIKAKKDTLLFFASITPAITGYNLEIDNIKEKIEDKTDIEILAKVLGKITLEIL